MAGIMAQIIKKGKNDRYLRLILCVDITKKYTQSLYMPRAKVGNRLM